MSEGDFTLRPMADVDGDSQRHPAEFAKGSKNNDADRYASDASAAE